MKSAVETLNPTRVRLTVEVPFEELKPEPRRRLQEDRRPGDRAGLPQGQGPAADHRPALRPRRRARRGGQRRHPAVLQRGRREREDPGARPARGRRHRVRGRRAADVHRRGRRPARDRAARLQGHRGHRRRRRGHRRGHRRAARRACATGSAPSSAWTGRPRPATTSPSTCPARPRTASHRGRAGRRACPTWSAPRPWSRASTTALTGMSAEESKIFASKLVAGDAPGEEVDITVKRHTRSRSASCPSSTTSSPRRPASSTPSTSSTRTCGRGWSGARSSAGREARDKVLEALHGADRDPAAGGRPAGRGPLPQRVDRAAAPAGRADLEDYLEHEGQTAEEFDAELEKRASEAMKAQFLLDAIAPQGRAHGQRRRSSPGT